MSQMYSIALCRVSTLEQATEGHSLDRQEQSVIRAAEKLGAPIKRIWKLDQSSRSGKNLKRKDLQEMLEFCKANKSVRYLIFDEVDRFMRSIDEFFWYKVEFQKLGVGFHVASDQSMNEDTGMAKFNRLIKVYQAELSNDERILKSTNGLKGRVKEGYYPFPTPQGYKKTVTPGLFEPDPIRFTLLQTAFREVLGGLTPAESLRRLNNKGYKTPQGKELQLARFMNILRCPYYAGLLRIKGWDFTNDHGLHQKMITRDEFEELQFILSGKKLRDQRKQHNPDFPLSNILLCECGGKFVGANQNNGKGKIYPKYRCRLCGKQYHRTEIHTLIDSTVDSTEISKLKGDRFIEKLEKIFREEQSECFQYIESLNKRLLSLQDKKNRLIISMVENPELKDDFVVSISEIKKEIENTEQLIRDARKIDDDLIEFISFSVNFLEHQIENWWNLSYEDMVRCKDLLYPQSFIINFDKKVYTPKISPILSLKPMNTTS